MRIDNVNKMKLFHKLSRSLYFIWHLQTSHVNSTLTLISVYCFVTLNQAIKNNSWHFTTKQLIQPNVIATMNVFFVNSPESWSSVKFSLLVVLCQCITTEAAHKICTQHCNCGNVKQWPKSKCFTNLQPSLWKISQVTLSCQWQPWAQTW